MGLVQASQSELVRTRRGTIYSRENIHPPTSIDVVRRAVVAALHRRHKMRCVIHGCPTRCDLVLKTWNSGPQQCDGTRNVRSSHGRAAIKTICIIGSVNTGTSACARSSDVGLYPATSIDCHRTAAAKGAMLSVPVTSAPTVSAAA